MRAAACTTLVLACCSLGSVPASALTLGKREFVCPVTGDTFRATVQLSGSYFGYLLDLRPWGAAAVPLPLPVCPDPSRFPLFKGGFTPAETRRIREIVTTPEYKRLVEAGDKPYYVAAYVRRLMGDDPAAVAGDLLAACWQTGQSDGARFGTYRRAARDAFAAVAAQPGQAPKLLARARFMQAELSRQLGEFDEALRLLDAWFPQPGPAQGLLAPEFVVREREAILARRAGVILAPVEPGPR